MATAIPDKTTIKSTVTTTKATGDFGPGGAAFFLVAAAAFLVSPSFTSLVASASSAPDIGADCDGVLFSSISRFAKGACLTVIASDAGFSCGDGAGTGVGIGAGAGGDTWPGEGAGKSGTGGGPATGAGSTGGLGGDTSMTGLWGLCDCGCITLSIQWATNKRKGNSVCPLERLSFLVLNRLGPRATAHRLFGPVIRPVLPGFVLTALTPAP